MKTFRTAIIHDSLIQRGGAERVVLALCKAFPDSDIITSTFNAKKTYPDFGKMKVVPLLSKHLNFLPLSVLTPLLPYLFKHVNLKNYELVIVSTSSAAHFSSFRHSNVIAYAHNTPRWLYQVKDFEIGLSWPKKVIASFLRPHYKKLDFQAASRVRLYFGNSKGTCKRIQESYLRSAILLNPPMIIEESIEKLGEPRSNYLLNVSRVRGYKNVQKVVDVALALKQSLVIVGKNAEFENQGDPGQIRVVSDLSDSELSDLYRNAKLLVCAAEEDFGLTPIEANYFGVPVVAPALGGYLETVINGKTGILAETSSTDHLTNAVKIALQTTFSVSDLHAHASQFSFEKFREKLFVAIQSYEFPNVRLGE